jgi:hypothetical protein
VVEFWSPDGACHAGLMWLWKGRMVEKFGKEK